MYKVKYKWLSYFSIEELYKLFTLYPYTQLIYFKRCHCGQSSLAQDFTSDASDLGCIDNLEDTRPLMSWESPSLYENTGYKIYEYIHLNIVPVYFRIFYVKE